MDFKENKDFRHLFEGNYNINDLIMSITANILGARVEEYDTLLIVDEIQDCPQARSSLKYFKLDDR